MRISVWCVLACFLCGACVSPAERCQGPLQPINPPASIAAQTPSAADPDESRP